MSYREKKPRTTCSTNGAFKREGKLIRFRYHWERIHLKALYRPGSEPGSVRKWLSCTQMVWSWVLGLEEKQITWLRTSFRSLLLTNQACCQQWNLHEPLKPRWSLPVWDLEELETVITTLQWFAYGRQMRHAEVLLETYLHRKWIAVKHTRKFSTIKKNFRLS